jgi:hypothetical protein
MPSKSKKQARFMAAVANNPSFAKKAGVSQDVGREFANADEGRNFAGGGVMPSYYDSKSGRPGKAVKKYREGNMVSRRSERRDLRDEEGRVISEQDDHADELRRLKGTRGGNRDAETQRVGGEERDERDEMRRLRDKAVGLGMKKGGKVRGAGIAIKGVRPAKMIKMS